jgi:hypothetical protein
LAGQASVAPFGPNPIFIFVIIGIGTMAIVRGTPSARKQTWQNKAVKYLLFLFIGEAMVVAIVLAIIFISFGVVWIGIDAGNDKTRYLESYVNFAIQYCGYCIKQIFIRS